MLLRIAKVSALTAILATAINAGDFSGQADKDLKALKNYMETKFKDPAKNRAFFPYTPESELKNRYIKGIKGADFDKGSYAYDKGGRSQYNDINEMPPYEDAIDEGQSLYENSKTLQKCFPKTDISGEYPMFDEKKGEVVTLTGAINNCLVAAGEKKWNPKKGKMAQLEAFFAHKSKEAGKKIDIKIPSKAAAEAYERGKKEYYSQRGYLKLSCASCHVQGSGQRVRAEYLSPLYGHVTHFPVYRLKWGELGTLERRLGGCEKNQGEKPHKPNSKWDNEILYFMSYMSNGLPIDGPDVRK